MPRHHPADGPRLKTLYVSQSTRKRRRRSSSRRRRRLAVVAAASLLCVAGVGVVFREQLTRRLNHILHKGTPPTLVRDVTASSAKPVGVQQAGNPMAAPVPAYPATVR